MEVGMDIEDDLYFEDLNKQISLLIMDDDDQLPLSHTSSVSLQVFSRAMNSTTHPQFGYNQRESKGTGVFIPQSSISHQRRRNRQGKYSYSSSSHSKYHKQQNNNNNQNSRGFINNSHGSYINILPPHNSFNTKKHVDYR